MREDVEKRSNILSTFWAREEYSFNRSFFRALFLTQISTVTGISQTQRQTSMALQLFQRPKIKKIKFSSVLFLPHIIHTLAAQVSCPRTLDTGTGGARVGTSEPLVSGQPTLTLEPQSLIARDVEFQNKTISL